MVSELAVSAAAAPGEELNSPHLHVVPSAIVMFAESKRLSCFSVS